MMDPEKYWDWYWTNIKIWLPVTVPIFLGYVVWAIIQCWAEHHEDDPPKDHFTKLF